MGKQVSRVSLVLMSVLFILFSVITASTASAWTVTPTKVGHGTISPSNSQTVSDGNYTYFDVVANSGYQIYSVQGCGIALYFSPTYKTGIINADCTVTATFGATVTTSIVSGSGTVSPLGATLFPENVPATISVTPSAGYTASVGGTCGGSLSGNTYTTNSITGNCTVDVTFTPVRTITSSVKTGSGSINPLGQQQVVLNNTQAYTLTPAANYQIDPVTGSCGGNLSGSTFTTSAVTTDCTVEANFSKIMRTVNASVGSGGHGAITPSGDQSIWNGTTASFTLTPDSGYISTIGGTCPNGTLSGNSYTTGTITAACTVVATFVPQYTVTPSWSGNGTISPSTQQLITQNGTAQFSINPQTNYSASVGGTCGTSGQSYSEVPFTYTTNPVSQNCSVIVTFSSITFSVMPSTVGNGSISPSTNQTILKGATASFTLNPTSDNVIDSVTGTCPAGTLTGNSFTTGAITADCTVIGNFILGHTVTPSAGTGGGISPSTPQLIGHNKTTTFTITPNAGYLIDTVTGCSGTLNTSVTPATYTTGPVNADCTVNASFVVARTVTPSAGTGGSISPSAAQLVKTGSTVAFTIMSNTGYNIVPVTGTCPAGTLNTSVNPVTYTTGAITSDCTVIANFSAINHAVISSKTGSGTITPSGSQQVLHGTTLSFTLTPDIGFHLGTVSGTCPAGTMNTAVTPAQYTTGTITGDCTVIVDFPGNQVSAQCPQGMTHYWKLDEAGGNSFVDSNGTNNATSTNALTGVTGFINGAQQFTQTSNVTVADDDTFDWGGSQSFSIEFWMKPDPSGGCTGTQILAGRDNTPATHLQWYLSCESGGALAFSVSDVNGAGGYLTGTKVLTDGAWHHIVAVRDAGANEMRLYVDGKIDGTKTNAQFPGGFAGTTPLTIGWLNNGPGYHFIGALDEVALYSKVLPVKDILTHFSLDRGYCDVCSTVNVMPLGDSITAGWDGTNQYYGYRRKLDLDLLNAGYLVDFVGSLQDGPPSPDFDIDHEGHGGFTATNVNANVYNWLTAHPADVILLHIGTNEIGNNAASIPAVETILNEIDRFSKKITVILARIINRTDAYSTQTTQFNNDLAAMANSRIANGDKIIIVDMEHALNYPADLNNAIHPSITGYNKMAGVWLTALNTFLPSCQPAPSTIISAPVTKGRVGVAYQYDVNAAGVPVPTYSLVTAPAWLTINSASGLIQGTPSAAGEYPVVLQASNGIGAPVTQSFTLRVAMSNILPHTNWWVVSCSDQQPAGQNRGCEKAIDGDPNTFWETQVSPTFWINHPHDIIINLGASYKIQAIRYLTRQDRYDNNTMPGINGTIKNFELYIGSNAASTYDLANLALSGIFVPDYGWAEEQKEWEVPLSAPKTGMAFRLRTLSSFHTGGDVHGGDEPSATVAELNVLIVNQYTVAASVTGGHGQISCTPTTVEEESNASCTITPDAGYQLNSLTDNGTNVTGSVTANTFNIVSAIMNHTLVATFGPVSYPITASTSTPEGGTVGCSPNPVVNGQNSTCTATPNTGYHTTAITVDGQAVTSYDPNSAFTKQYTNVVDNSHVITATFAINQFTITATTNDAAKGTVSCPSPANYGSSVNCTVSPVTGSHLLAFTDNGIDKFGSVTGNTYTITNVTANHTVASTFVNNTFSITVTKTGTGTVDCPASVSYGNTAECLITPGTANGYYYDHATGSSGYYQASTSKWIFPTVTANQTLDVVFTINQYTITTAPGANGTITPGTTIVDWGGSQNFAVAPSTGYHITNVKVDNVDQTIADPKTFSQSFTNVTAVHSVAATFAIDTFLITKSAGANGTITCTNLNGDNTVNWNVNSTCTVHAATGYHIATITADSSPVTGFDANVDYVKNFLNVTATHSIAATFAINTFNVSAAAGAHGSLDASTTSPKTIDWNTTTSFKFNADAGYHVTGVTGCGISYTNTDITVASYTATTGPITADCTASATFAINKYPFASTTNSPAGTGSGTLTCTNVNGDNTVTYGSTVVCTAAPQSVTIPKSHVGAVTVDGAANTLAAGNTFTFAGVSASHTINIAFDKNTFTITPTVKGGLGTIVCTPATQSGQVATVDEGANTVCTVTPGTGYTEAFVDTHGIPTSINFYGSYKTYSISAIAQNLSVDAWFNQTGYYTIFNTNLTPDWGDFTCTPNPVTQSQSATCTAAPHTGYDVKEMKVNSVSQGATAAWTFTNVQSPQSISIEFEPQQFVITPTSTVMIDFDALVNGKVLSNEYAPLGVTFSGATVQTCATPPCGLYPPYSAQNNARGTSLIQIIFDPAKVGPVTHVSARITGDSAVTMSAYKGTGELIGTASTSGANTATPNQLLFIDTAAVTIGRVDMQGTGANFTIDDLQISVPGSANGSISCTPALVNYNESSTCTLTVPVGRTLASLIDNTVEQKALVSGNQYLISPVTAAHQINAAFGIQMNTVGGTVNNLLGSGLVLQDNGGDDLAVSPVGGSFAFNSKLPYNGTYSVTVKAQPTGPNQSCSVLSGGTGTISGSDINTVALDCTTNKYYVGVTVSGLASGKSVVLQNNGGDNLTVGTNTSANFATRIADHGAYAVTVLTNPTTPNQTCVVTGGNGGGNNGSGTVAGVNVTGIAVTCTTNQYGLTGSVSGLAALKTVVLHNSSGTGEDLSVNANGSFAFINKVTDLTAYSVTVKTNPTNPCQTCIVSSGSGNIAGGDVSGILVSCATNTYNVGGSISNLGAGKTVVLHNSSGTGEDLSVNTGSFTFINKVADLGAYGVTVKTQPANQICSVTSGDSGNIAGNNVTTVSVSCTNNYTVTATAEGDGSILCDGQTQVTVEQGGTVNCTMTPNPILFNQVLDVQVDGTTVGAVPSYQFTGISGNRTIHAVFPITTCTWTSVDCSQPAADCVAPTVSSCVTSAAQLQQCLTAAQADGKHNRIMAVQGAYKGQFLYGATENFDLNLEGGYAPGCATFSYNPELTVLDGQGLGAVLDLVNNNQSNNSTGGIAVEGFHVKNGINTVAAYAGAGITVYTDTGNVTLSGNIISDSSAVNGGGIGVDTESGNVLLDNNIIFKNTATTQGGGVWVRSRNTTGSNNVTLLNNTIADSSTTGASFGGGVFVLLNSSLSTADLTNNIVWNNTTPGGSCGDLYINTALTKLTLMNNDFDTVNGSCLPATYSIPVSNLNVDPQFVNETTGDYHLKTTSTVVDMGNNAHALLPVVDIDGQPRIIGPAVDIGADELPICKNCTSVQSVNLTATPGSPQLANIQVTFKATASGGSGTPQYQFWVRDPQGNWTMKQSYCSSNTYDWTAPSVAGAYQIAVWAKNYGSGAVTYEMQQVMDYTVSATKSLSLGSDKTSPQVAGVAVRFTATSGGFTNPQYQFWVRDPLGAWTVKQSYGSLNTYDWTMPSVAGAYQIAVWIKNQGSGATYEIQQVMDYTVTVAKSMSLGSDKTSPQAAGVAVRFTATSGGFTNPQCQFWVRDPLGAWTVKQSYGSLNTYDWTMPSVAGAYQIAVWVKSQGSGETYEIQQVMDYTVTVSKSLSLGSDKTSPQAAGVAVRFTATSGGFTNPQYQFWVRDPLGAWTVKQSYGSLNTYDWTTPSVAGAYQIAVWVKSQGSGETYEIQQLMDYTVTVAKSMSLGSDKTSPQAAGVAVRFTATSGGFTNPQYQFWVRDPLGAWTVKQSYGSLNTYDWITPTQRGAYQVAVWVKSQGSGETYEIQQLMDYTIQ